MPSSYCARSSAHWARVEPLNSKHQAAAGLSVRSQHSLQRWYHGACSDDADAAIKSLPHFTAPPPPPPRLSTSRVLALSRRRSLAHHTYSAVMCENARRGQECPLGDACPNVRTSPWSRPCAGARLAGSSSTGS